MLPKVCRINHKNTLRTSKLCKDWLDDILDIFFKMSLKVFSAFPGRAQPKISTWFSKPNQSLI